VTDGIYFFALNSFLLSTYEIFKVLVSLAKTIFFITNFHVLGLFIPKKLVWSEKKIPSVTRRCRRFLDEISGAASSAVLSARKLKFWLPTIFEPTCCTLYSEF
jgi:hypothetical protein